MRPGPAAWALSVSTMLALSGCAVHKNDAAQKPFNPEAFNFYDDGRQVYLGVDVRPYRLAGDAEDLAPFQLAIVNKSLDLLEIPREGILVEGEDGKTLPLATYEEYRTGYGRSRIDDRAGLPFRETLLGRFPTPPYHYRDLEFFPSRTDAFSPRAKIDLRRGEVAVGWIYLTIKGLRPKPNGRYTLLVRPKGMDPYVVEFPAHE